MALDPADNGRLALPDQQTPVARLGFDRGPGLDDGGEGQRGAPQLADDGDVEGH